MARRGRHRHARAPALAGRGNFKGAASGAPAVVRISVTDAYGKVVPLVAPNYQWSPQNPSAPLWRIGGGTSGIEWDASPISNGAGKRIRQLATITLTQYTPIVLAERSATVRSKKLQHEAADGMSGHALATARARTWT